jgi:hypothetical protein
MGETFKPSTKLQKRIPIATLLGEVEIPKKELITRLIDAWQIAEAFEEVTATLKQHGGEMPTLNQLRAEFVQGTKDYNFAQRLKVFVARHIRN